MAIWDFSNYETEELQQAVELYERLGKLGLSWLDEDGIAELNDELERRIEKIRLMDIDGEDDGLTYEQEDNIIESGLEKWRENKNEIERQDKGKLIVSSLILSNNK